MQSLRKANLKGKRALIRVDFNVPLNAEFQISDDKRIQEALPTLRFVLENGGSIVLMSHLGRPKNGPEPKFSLAHLVEPLSKLLNQSVKFVGDCIGDEAFSASAHLKAGEVLLLENLRFYKEEEKGDVEFAMKLAKHGDIYINDAFGTAHRAHASTAIIAHFMSEKYPGFLMLAELENANKVLANPARPFTAIMGGAKVSDKIEIMNQLLDKVDNLIIGGGMAFTFLRAKGYAIGKSLCEEDKINLAATILKSAREKNVTVLTPIDSVVSTVFGEEGRTAIVKNDSIPEDMMGLDIGPESHKAFHQMIMESKTLLWNGPMGVFEMKKFANGTIAMARSIVAATEAGAFSLIGGGDSAAAIKAAGLEDKVSYVSTGGGALLEYLEGKVLPGVAALQEEN